MAIKIRLELGDEAKQLLSNKHLAKKMIEAMDNAILQDASNILADTHLVEAGLIQDDCWRYVRYQWLKRLQNRD